ncbi:MAG: zinc ribbon domain-containing protein [Candidatus Sumerlaeia bacterium]|nr:zinc ribbon domain-containing protein [Candidatus Sumerlaeia bacterium]
MKHADESIADYRCVKCRNTTAVVRKINLTKGLLPELLIRGGGRYRFVTCTLCGYTEIYDLSVYARKPASETADNKAAHLAPETPPP